MRTALAVLVFAIVAGANASPARAVVELGATRMVAAPAPTGSVFDDGERRLLVGGSREGFTLIDAISGARSSPAFPRECFPRAGGGGLFLVDCSPSAQRPEIDLRVFDPAAGSTFVIPGDAFNARLNYNQIGDTFVLALSSPGAPSSALVNWKTGEVTALREPGTSLSLNSGDLIRRSFGCFSAGSGTARLRLRRNGVLSRPLGICSDDLGVSSAYQNVDADFPLLWTVFRARRSGLKLEQARLVDPCSTTSLKVQDIMRRVAPRAAKGQPSTFEPLRDALLFRRSGRLYSIPWRTSGTC